MVKPKVVSKKQQKRGVDFKKIKRKVGRKLPPPKNTTNTEIKSKAIILPEQSVASEKAGLAVSKKGLTLKELLQQTSHHNPKVRKDALIGIRDILLKYPTELRSHKLAIIEKLRERISDDDKVVRETLYQLLKSVVFPGCKEDTQGPFISLMMAYIFNAMTHLAIDVRLMAFNFFDLVLQHYPSCFSLYAEKIFQNYEDILRKNQFYLQDKGKLKNALGGLVHCLLLLPSNKGDHGSPCEKDDAARGILHAFESETHKDPAEFCVINKKLKEFVPVLISCFQDFIRLVHTMPHLDAQSFDCMLSILQSIDHVVRFFAYWIENSQQELQVSMPPNEGPDVTIQGLTITPSLLKKLFDLFPLNPKRHLSGKDDDKYFVLNVIITEIFLCSSDCLYPPAALLEKFLEFIASALTKNICSGRPSGKAFYEKQILSLIPFTPKLVWQVSGYWKSRILQAFTNIFRSCNLESSLKWACLSAIEEMLVPRQGLMYLDASDQELLDYQITWIRELPLLLIMLGDKHPLRSRSVLSLLLRLGQCAASNPSFAQEYDNMKYSFAEFYCICMGERNISYGPFVRLDTDAQELSVCCLYYLSAVDSHLLKSLAWSCLYDGLEPFIIFRMIEVLHSAYKIGHIQIADHISFFITLLSYFKVFPEKSCPMLENDEISNHGTFMSVTSAICSCLLQMGDDYLVFQILEKVVLDQLPLKPALDNSCALLRVLVALDSRSTRLSQQSIMNLGNFLPGYLIDVVTLFPEYDDKSLAPVVKSTCHYYLLPCYFLFYRNNKLLNLLLNMMASLVTEKRSSLSSFASDHSSRISAILSVVLLMHKDVKIRKILSSCKADVDLILQNILAVQSSEEINMVIEERHKINAAVDQLKTVASTSLSER
ncbi:uncharacterized protein LOC130776972 isoform X2 [Actinidia eriantha]|uniref:uncharacterized protein LOC130776972 isoform X2 n=1 Tax=Actinidia eriantha TaxID=165200 RepID=UPI00258302BB|nr:uncharacterized protein LOC130776972 isoform X2 [Actinidia eriantha]